jgi:signal transduction histidine kinase
MNRLWVRLLFAMLAVGFVAGVGQWFVMGYLIYAFSNNLSDQNTKTISGILQKAVEKFSLSDSEGWILVAIAFASVIVALFSAILISSRIARPLWAVSKAAEQVAEGEWTARASVHIRATRGNSETARLVRNFNTMADSLERLEVERTASVAAIAHELRTPLTVLRGRLEAIRDGVLELDSTESNLLVQQVELLSRLVGDLRTLSLAEAGKLSLQFQITDLATLTRSIVSSFEARAGEKGVRLEIATPEKLEVKLDPNRYHQVLSNLLENALRHTPEDGLVRVNLEARELSAELVVRDSGVGIPPDALEQIFERFYRVDSSRNRASGGSGLGLAIVRAVVEAHGGIILARNAQSGGAEFRVSLPLEDSKQLPLRAHPSLKRKSVKAVAKKVDLEDQTLSSILYLLLGLPFGILYFVVLIVGFSAGVPLVIVWIGLPILYATLVIANSFARFERWLLEGLLNRPVPYQIELPLVKTTWLGRLRQRLGLLSTWKEIIFLILKFPIGIISTVLVVAWFGLVAAVAIPYISKFTRLNVPNIQFGGYQFKIDSLQSAVTYLVLGVVLLFILLMTLKLLAWINVVFARWMLSNIPKKSKTEPKLEIRSKNVQL